MMQRYNENKYLSDDGLTFDCYYNKLIELPELPSTIKVLNCSYNNLTELPELPQTIEILHCSDNKLTKLPKLPPNIKELYCSKNNLTELPELPPTLERLYCYNNNLLYKSNDIKDIRKEQKVRLRKKKLDRIKIKNYDAKI